MKIKIDIVIPVYNEERFIKSCLKTVLDFDCPNNVSFEIFLVDGGSTDNTINIINRYLKKYNFVNLLQNAKKFQACAMNIAIKSSDADGGAAHFTFILSD